MVSAPVLILLSPAPPLPSPAIPSCSVHATFPSPTTLTADQPPSHRHRQADLQGWLSRHLVDLGKNDRVTGGHHSCSSPRDRGNVHHWWVREDLTAEWVIVVCVVGQLLLLGQRPLASSCAPCIWRRLSCVELRPTGTPGYPSGPRRLLVEQVSMNAENLDG